MEAIDARRSTMAAVALKSGHVQPIWAGHPWVFAQAVHHIEGVVAPGDEVDVIDPKGVFVGRGFYSPRSAIAVRLYSRTPETSFDRQFFRLSVERALARRRALGLPSEATTGYRVLHGEGDDVPGLIVDRYGETLVVQTGTIGLKRREGMLLDVLASSTGARSIIDRSSGRLAELEGFTAASGLVRGAPVSDLEFVERGLKFQIPSDLSQKTGYYFDQRPLRARIEQLASGRRVLDAYTYVGSIALSAARGGASEVLGIDSNGIALAVARLCARTNGLDSVVQYHHSSARDALRAAAQQGGYDLVVCDPPKLSPTRTAQRRALAAMRQIAAQACRATAPGGIVALCSCSAALSVGDVTRALALGARDVDTRPLVLERLFQGPDHPVPAAFPEGLYLCTVLAEVREA